LNVIDFVPDSACCVPAWLEEAPGSILVRLVWLPCLSCCQPPFVTEPREKEIMCVSTFAR
jgi:hypothetical protein